MLTLILLLISTLLLHAENGRKISDFNQNWLFEQDDWIGFYHGSWMNWNETNWIPVQTPHCFNADDTFDPERGYYRGFAWYRKHFTIPASEKGRILKIRFGAIGNESEIWVNEQFKGKFTTGYTPIEIDITDVMRYDQDNVIAIRVNNLHNDEIPPGRWRMDYNVYGGIYREVELVSLAPVHFIDRELFVTTPDVSQEKSSISVSAALKNTTGTDKKVQITGRLYDGSELLTTFTHNQLAPAGMKIPIKEITTAVHNIDLWSPAHPKLYRLELSLTKNSVEIDKLVTKIGFRSFRFDSEEGFFLNGKSLKLNGLNRHQCYPGLGNAVPERLQVEDAIILKELGANYVRCAHYPQHVSFLDACDSLGLLVYEEVASWQHIGGDEFIGHMDYMMEEMIRRDRNHPSVMLWGMMNEGRSWKMFDKMKRTANELDPTRPVSYAENHIDLGTKEGTIFQPGVLGLNYSLDKYDQLHQDFPGIPLISTECTNADGAKLGDMESQLRAVQKIKEDLDFIESRPFIAGSCIWGFHDYGTNYKPVWPMQESGLVNEYREFKEAAWYLKSRWTEEPFIHIAGHWDHAEGETVEVQVWSNCDRVDLFLNGEKIPGGDSGKWLVDWKPGELKTVAQQGKVKTEHTIQTAGSPAKVACSAKATSLKADGFDALPVRALITDVSGNPVPVNGKKVTFEVTGPAKLIGIGGNKAPETLQGITHILVQSTGENGNVVITAKADGLQPANIQLTAE